MTHLNYGIPYDLIDTARTKIENIPIESDAFEMLNFAESSLWMRTLTIVNDHGLPDTLSPKLTAWATASFRLGEDTKLADQLRRDRVDRSYCMNVNRKAGSKQTLTDLHNGYLILQAYRDLGVEVDMPDSAFALQKIIDATI